MLDKARAIEVAHVHAAVAVWKYCEDSTLYLFGNATGDPIADAILRELKEKAPKGVNRDAIFNLFSRHESRANIEAALKLLKDDGLARKDMHKTGGRPAEVWFAT